MVKICKMNGILKCLNEENYSDQQLYADTKEELIENLSKIYDCYEWDSGSVCWNGAGYYIIAGCAGSDEVCKKIDEAINDEISWKYALNSDGFPIFNNIYNDDNIDIYLEFIDDYFIPSNSKFKDLEGFDITIKIPDIYNFKYVEGYEQQNEEENAKLENNTNNTIGKFNELFQNKNNVYHEPICKKWQEINFYCIETYVYAKSKEEIEKLYTKEFKDFCENSEIQISID